MNPEAKKWFLNFVGEGILNPDYAGWVGGRIEVSEDWPESNQPWPVMELRYLTPKAEEFYQFAEEYDFKTLNRQQLGRMAVENKMRFQEYPR